MDSFEILFFSGWWCYSVKLMIHKHSTREQLASLWLEFIHIILIAIFFFVGQFLGRNVSLPIGLSGIVWSSNPTPTTSSTLLHPIRYGIVVMIYYHPTYYSLNIVHTFLLLLLIHPICGGGRLVDHFILFFFYSSTSSPINPSIVYTVNHFFFKRLKINFRFLRW